MTPRSGQPSARARTRTVAAGATAGLLTALAPLSMSVAQAAPREQVPGGKGAARSCDARNNNTYTKLLECITAEGVLKHQEAFQQIADASTDPNYPGSRAAGTEGYAGSVDYVKRVLEEAGWTVTLDPVDITYNFPVVLRQLTRRSRVPVGCVHRKRLRHRDGAGHPGRHQPDTPASQHQRVRGGGLRRDRLERVRRHRPGPARHVQLRRQGLVRRAGRRGGGDHLQPGQHLRPRGPDRRQRLDLGDGTTVQHGIPVVGASFADGVALAQTGSTAFIEVLAPETRQDFNVLAEQPGVNDDNVVMAGAHLDSVPPGPASTTTARARRRCSRWPRRCARSTAQTRCASRGGPARSRAWSVRGPTSRV